MHPTNGFRVIAPRPAAALAPNTVVPAVVQLPTLPAQRPQASHSLLAHAVGYLSLVPVAPLPASATTASFHASASRAVCASAVTLPQVAPSSIDLGTISIVTAHAFPSPAVQCIPPTPSHPSIPTPQPASSVPFTRTHPSFHATPTTPTLLSEVWSGGPRLSSKRARTPSLSQATNPPFGDENHCRPASLSPDHKALQVDRRRKRQKCRDCNDMPLTRVAKTGGDPRIAMKVNEWRRATFSQGDLAIQGLWVGETMNKCAEFYLVQPTCAGALPIRSVVVDMECTNGAIKVFSYGSDITDLVQAQHPAIDLRNTSAFNVAVVLECVSAVRLCEGYSNKDIDKEVLENESFKSLLDLRSNAKVTALAMPFPFPFLSACNTRRGEQVAGTYRAIACARVAALPGSTRCGECQAFMKTVRSRPKSSNAGTLAGCCLVFSQAH